MKKKPLITLILVLFVMLTLGGAAVYFEKQDSRQVLPSIDAETLRYHFPVEQQADEFAFYSKRFESDPGVGNLNALAQAYFKRGRRSGRNEEFQKARMLTMRSLKEQPQRNRSAKSLE